MTQLYPALLAFFYTMAVKDGQYLQNPYLRADGKEIIEGKGDEATLSMDGQTYHRFNRLNGRIREVQLKVDDIADLDTPSGKNFSVLLEFFEEISMCSTSMEIMRAPVYCVNTPKSTRLMHDFKNLIKLKITTPENTTIEHFKAENLIPVHVLFDAISTLSQSMSQIDVLGGQYEEMLNELKAIGTPKSLDAQIIEQYAELFQLMPTNQALLALARQRIEMLENGMRELQKDVWRAFEKGVDVGYASCSVVFFHGFWQWSNAGFSLFKTIVTSIYPSFSLSLLERIWGGMGSLLFVKSPTVRQAYLGVFALTMAYQELVGNRGIPPNDFCRMMFTSPQALRRCDEQSYQFNNAFYAADLLLPIAVGVEMLSRPYLVRYQGNAQRDNPAQREEVNQQGPGGPE